MSEPAIIQPVVLIPPTVEAADPGVTDEGADRFTEDLTVNQHGSFQEWLQAHRPLPTLEKSPEADALVDDIPTD